jgi:hypothetical protein
MTLAIMTELKRFAYCDLFFSFIRNASWCHLMWQGLEQAWAAGKRRLNP